MPSQLHRPMSAIVPPVICLLLIGMWLKCLPEFPARSIPETSVAVTVFFPDPSANLLVDSVLANMELAIVGTPGLEDMAFAVSRDRATIVFFFEPGSDANRALSNVRQRIQNVENDLPPEVQRQGVVVISPVANGLLFVTVETSGDRTRLSNLHGSLFFKLLPEARRAHGIASVMTLGDEHSSVRVIFHRKSIERWNHETGHHLTAHEIATKVLTDASNSLNWHLSPPKNQESETIEYVCTSWANPRRRYPFEEIIIAATAEGEILRVKDVGEVKIAPLYPSYDGVYSNADTFHSPLVLLLANGANRADVLKQAREIIKQVKKESRDLDAKCDVSDGLPASWRFSRHISR